MAAEARKSRKGNFSQEEIDVLVTTVMQNHDILYGETSKSFFHKEIRNQVWNIVLEEVNKVSLERRTLNELKNKWKKCQYNRRSTDTPDCLDPPADSDYDDLAHNINRSAKLTKTKRKRTTKMKTKKHRNRTNMPNPAARAFPTGYEPSFKRSVILYAEQKNNQEARKRFGISEETIRRWRKLRQDIMEKAQQCIRRSQRHTMGQGSFSESGPAPGKKDKDKSIEHGEDTAEEEDPKKDLDSMPLQQRLSQNHNETPAHPQESLLQSQPISPTKLKVTRQGKPQQPPPTPPPPAPPQVCLKWNSHHVNMQTAFPSLLTREQYVDATLVSEGQTLKCHRMILSSCSPYFEEVLNGIGPFQHPVLFMKDIPFWVLKALCDFMYAGEVHILQDKLQELLSVAASLKIKGLGSPSDSNQDLKPVVPEIKQEIDSPVPKLPEKPLKEEKEEDPPPPHPKPTRHEVVRPSKRREDKRSRHSTQATKEKVVEEPPPPKVAPKVAPKIVTKVVLAKPPAAATKATVKNVLKNVVKPNPKPSTSKTTHTSRKNDTSRKSEKHKVETVIQKEKEKEKEKPALKKDNINDPLDLLEPVYEEIAKEDPPQALSPSKLKEKGNVPVKKSCNRKVKKRRYAEYAEDRDESPPPLFQCRKGTRSRPNVKIPKYFHSHYDDSLKETIDATIVREPHTDQNDPLIGVEVSEIKAEPLDVEENTIEVEENLVNFMVQDQEMISQEGEEIIGNYDSPLVNIKIESKRNTPNIFKKDLDPQPMIMNLHTVTTESNVRLLNIKEENVQIVDISSISSNTSRMEETLPEPNSFSEIEPRQNDNPSEIIISSVQSMAESLEETPSREADKSLTGVSNSNLLESEMPPTCQQSQSEADEQALEAATSQKAFAGVGLRPLESLTSQPNAFTREVEGEEASEIDPLASVITVVPQPESQEMIMETDEPPLNIRIENIRSEKEPQPTEDLMQLGREHSEELHTSGPEKEPQNAEDLTQLGSGDLEEFSASGLQKECQEESQNKSQNAEDLMQLGSGDLEDFGASESQKKGQEESQNESQNDEDLMQLGSEHSEKWWGSSGDNLNVLTGESQSSGEQHQNHGAGSSWGSLDAKIATLGLHSEGSGVEEPQNGDLDAAKSLETEQLVENMVEGTLEPCSDGVAEDLGSSVVEEGESECPLAHTEKDRSSSADVDANPSHNADLEDRDELIEDSRKNLESISVPQEAAASALNEDSTATVGAQLEQAMFEDNGAATANSEAELNQAAFQDNTTASLEVELNRAVSPQNNEATAANLETEIKQAVTEDYEESNIEAELEQCLASTSNMVPPKPPDASEEPPDASEEAAFLEDSEDFTKDIEFDNFGSGNRPTNYLAIDFAEDEKKDDDFDFGLESGDDNESGGGDLSYVSQWDDESDHLEESDVDSLALEEYEYAKRNNLDDRVRCKPLSAETALTGEQKIEAFPNTSIEIERKTRADYEQADSNCKSPENEGNISSPHSSRIDDGLTTNIEQCDIGDETPDFLEGEQETDTLQNKSGCYGLTGAIEEDTSPENDFIDQNPTCTEEEQEMYESQSRNVDDDLTGDIEDNFLPVEPNPSFVQDAEQRLFPAADFADRSPTLLSPQGDIELTPGGSTQDRFTTDIEPVQSPQILNDPLERLRPGCENDIANVTDNCYGPTPEDEMRMEETLLADLDDDIVMKDATTSREDDGSEKTLEMIVNDLNESLGEMKK